MMGRGCWEGAHKLRGCQEKGCGDVHVVCGDVDVVCATFIQIISGTISMQLR